MPDQQNRAEQIFAAALEMSDAAARAAFVQGECAGDDALRSEVESLLAAHERADAFMQTERFGPWIASSAGAGRGTSATTGAEAGAPDRVAGEIVRAPSEKSGDRIGRYKLLEQIGEGGFGTVWMAEQEEPVRRRVALKIIKLGMDTREVVARFEAERQALALMDHPHIAKVFDGGATESGRSFFVMELVRGQRVTEYWDQKKLPMRERLDLFMQVCQAVQHAHQKGIIHRDLKPSNILVTVNDGIAVPKVIDFGVAKATGQRLTDKTLFTKFQQLLGTPAYMSPEQAEMTSVDIDTRSDIYSLGVLLYELLTGRTPFDTKELLRAGMEAMTRTIREQDPVRPSARLSTLTAMELTTVAQQRRTEAPKLINLVRGDLDWVVMKCLEKDRARRYDAANGLARDIERHLNNEPVVACPPSRAYRFRKLVRRNKLVFGAAAAVLAALLLGLGISTWMFFRERAGRREQARLRKEALVEKAKAQTEAAKSEQVAAFLKDMLRGVDASVARGRDTTMLKEILDKTALRISKDLTNQPDVEADLGYTIAMVYLELVQSREAEAMHRKVLALRRKLFGDDDARVAASLTGVASALLNQGKVAEAEQMAREALAIQRRVRGNNDQDIADSLNALGVALKNQGKLTEAETTLSEGATIQRQLLGDSGKVAALLHSLALTLQAQGKLAESETLHREALEMCRRLGLVGPRVNFLLRTLTTALIDQGKMVEAEIVIQELLARGNDDKQRAIALDNLAIVLVEQGRLAEAESMLRESLAISIKARLDDTSSLKLLADLLKRQEKMSEAEALYGEWLQSLHARLPSDDPALAAALATCTSELLVQEKFAEAEPLARECLAIREKQLPDDWLTFSARSTLGGCLLGQKKYSDAASLLLSGYQGMKQREHKIPPVGKARLKETIQRLVRLYEATERPDQVAQWKTELTQWYRMEIARYREVAEGGGKALLWDDHRAQFFSPIHALNGLAWLLATCEDAAVRDGPGAVAYAKKAVAATNRKIPAALATLAAAYAEAGEFAKAIGIQKEAIALEHRESLKKDLAARLRLYESNTPYREP